MLFFWNARARNAHVEATSHHPFPAQAGPDAALFRVVGSGCCGKPVAFRTKWTVQRLRVRPKVSANPHFLTLFAN